MPLPPGLAARSTRASRQDRVGGRGRTSEASGTGAVRGAAVDLDPREGANVAKTRLLSGGLFWASVALAGCASADPGLSGEVARLRQELYRARAAVGEATQRFERLEARVEQLESRPPSSERATAERPLERVSPRRLRVVRIAPPGAESAPPEDDDRGATDHGEPPVMIRIRGERSDRLQVDREVLARPDPVLDAPEDPERAYRRALSALRDDADPAGALKGFRAFLKEHPEHALADNALYWKGESLQTLVEHEAALKSFERLMALHPQSHKIPWAMLRAAESHLALGRAARGHALLERVRVDHSGTEPAKLAQARLEALAAVDRSPR